VSRVRHGDERPSRLIAIRGPTRAEARAGAEIVFVREVRRSERETVLAAVCYESWQQWNAPHSVLCDNIEIIQLWRDGSIPGFSPSEDTRACTL
jgi:hypothetical protein